MSSRTATWTKLVGGCSRVVGVRHLLSRFLLSQAGTASSGTTAASLTACLRINSGNHADCFPPIVIHITDGETSDGGNPEEYAESVRSLATSHGNVLMFNCHLSHQAADKIVFPGSVEMMPGDFARTLFRMSSVLPTPMVRLATTEGFKLEPNSKGFVFNADTVSLLQFLDMGTRVSKNLR